MSQTTYTLSQLNGIDASQFVQVLGSIYEYSPWVAEQVATQRPFASAEVLAAAMYNAMDTADIEPRLRFVHTHPELTGRVAVRDELIAESTCEQSGAGLNQRPLEEFACLQALNAQYNEKFGFPFTLAVCSCDRHGIIDNSSERMENNRDTELRASLEQIHRIAGFRLAGLVVAN